MKIALASPSFPASVADALQQLELLTKEAAAQEAAIICFPETFIPGYPLPEYQPEKPTQAQLQAALDQACTIAAANHIAIILPMDWYEGDRFLNLAFVISKTGAVLGYQTKNQLDPSEDTIWQAGTERSVWTIDGVTFGITICHEGFRYPESVRWAAMQGAAIVFHPQCTASNAAGTLPTEWGHTNSPYYEKAMLMRANENTIYFASVNYAARFQDSASSVIGPDGTCIAYQPYGSKPGIIAAEVDTAKATGLLARRFKSALYHPSR